MEVGEPAFFRVATRRLRAAIISSGGRGTVTESANVAFAVRVGLLAKEPAPNGVRLVPTAWPSSPGLDARPPKSAVTVVWYLLCDALFERRPLASVWVHGDPRAEPLETSA